MSGLKAKTLSLFNVNAAPKMGQVYRDASSDNIPRSHSFKGEGMDPIRLVPDDVEL